jgi:MFS family permease
MVPRAGNAIQSVSVNALLAFGAALISLRLSGDLVRRWRARKRPELAAWAGGLAAYALAAGALAWGSAAGWTDAAFRVYYLGGALLTAALLGAGSLLLVGRRWAAPLALVYAGLAIGVAVAVPLQTSLSGTEIPEAQDVLDIWPARVLAILGNSLGTLAVVVVALATFRSRPRGNALILAGIAVAGIGSGLAGLGVGALAPAIAVAAILLYAGFVAPSALPMPHPDENGNHGKRDRRLDEQAGGAPVSN